MVPTKGFPPGHIGQLLSVLYEIKLNGLEYLLQTNGKNNSEPVYASVLNLRNRLKLTG